MLGCNFSELEADGSVLILVLLSWFGFTGGSCVEACLMYTW